MSIKTKKYLLQNFDFEKQKKEIRNNSKVCKLLNTSSTELHLALNYALNKMKEDEYVYFYGSKYTLQLNDLGRLTIKIGSFSYTTDSNYIDIALMFFSDDKNMEEQIKEIQKLLPEKNIKYVKSPYKKLKRTFLEQYYDANGKTLDEVRHFLKTNEKMLFHEINSSSGKIILEYSGYYSERQLIEYLQDAYKFMFMNIDSFTVLNIEPFKTKTKRKFVEITEPEKILISIE